FRVGRDTAKHAARGIEIGGGAMRFAIYLRCFQRGAPGGVCRDGGRALFSVDETEPRRDHLVLRDDEHNPCSMSVVACASDTTLIESISVSRPCKEIGLWNALLEVMRMAPIVLYFPGDRPPLVADASVCEHLPRDMIKALGSPRVVE